MARSGVMKQAVKISPSADDMASADAVAVALNDVSEPITLDFSDGRKVELPPSLASALRSVAIQVAEGNEVTVLPLEAILTPAEAAEILGLSRPFVAGLLDSGAIKSTRLPDSSHRRIRLVDVLEFARTREQRGEGRRRIARTVADAGLPY